MPITRISPEEADAFGIPRVSIHIGPVPARPAKALGKSPEAVREINRNPAKVRRKFDGGWDSGVRRR
jgi:hypothetical protein